MRCGPRSRVDRSGHALDLADDLSDLSDLSDADTLNFDGERRRGDAQRGQGRARSDRHHAVEPRRLGSERVEIGEVNAQAVCESHRRYCKTADFDGSVANLNSLLCLVGGG